MKLASLLEGLNATVRGNDTISILDVVFDSRKVTPGSLFVALPGSHVDGHHFVEQAIRSGAAAVLSSRPHTYEEAVSIVVKDPFEALSHVSIRFWEDASSKLLIVGITGTNGKTTTSYLMESILNHTGLETGVLGTINYRFKDQEVPAPNTTPFASDIHRFMAGIRKGEGSACVMEVSSHALALGRVNGIHFDIAIFTNLTQDHLDFHKTMEDYGKAKLKLFESLDPSFEKPFSKAAIINADDPWAAKFRAAARVPVITYGLKDNADIRAENVICDAQSSRFLLKGQGLSSPVELQLLGEYNVYNALAAAAAAVALKLPLAKIIEGLQSLAGVPGRMERVNEGQSFTVVVDYAHTDDALRNVIEALRRLNPKRLITVFGCGGDRDRTKRPLMGEVAARLSDEVIVTSDNPRSEDPARIALDVEVGIRRIHSDHYKIILERSAALAEAFKMAGPGDIVLIAGKGHETYQIVGKDVLPFDDRAESRRLLSLGKPQ